MEKLKSMVPMNLKQMVAKSTVDNLTSTSSSLLDFFHHSHQFHQMIQDLTETNLCGKNKDAALELKRKGNHCFVTGDSARASGFYSQALRVAPVDAEDSGKNLVATLYLNRASSFHKIGLLTECLRDCDRALFISSNYAKVWFRRGQTNASMRNYEDAVNDLSVAENLEMSLSGKKQVECERLSVLAKWKTNSSSLDQHSREIVISVDEKPQIKLQCTTTPTKGRGMSSVDDIPPASLIHSEEPYSVIISKNCRETHCHFCFDELPADTVSCTSCSIALYCSEQCKIRAGGQTEHYPELSGIPRSLSSDLKQYVLQTTTSKDYDVHDVRTAEHKHECHGVNWSATLPSETVLAGRILAKCMEENRISVVNSSAVEILDLSHHYPQMVPEDKLELHIYSIVLLHCLHKSKGFELPINGTSISQLVIIIAQIKVNSMAIVRLKFIDDRSTNQSGPHLPLAGTLTSNAHQVRVGQAIYSAGSLFNHSCQPNIHIYFLKRTLFVRSTEFIAAGCPLEISYGPQIGQWDCKDRQQFLKDQYSFECQCSGCLELNLPDLVINAYHCVDPNCMGVVLNNGAIKYEKEKVNSLRGATRKCSSHPCHPAAKLKDDSIKEVAHFLLGNARQLLPVGSDICLGCGASRDLVSANATVEEVGFHFRRLQEAINSRKDPTNILSDALGSLNTLQSLLHVYNKRVAEVHDDLAHAFCILGEFQRAVDHCKSSVKILEKLYGPDHISIGHELLKLSTIQVSACDHAAVDSINRANTIFSKYYGHHMSQVLPTLQPLKNEARKLVQ